MPVRKIPRSHGSLTGLHAHPTGDRAIAFESSLERDFITLMLFEPDVVRVEEQPVRIPVAAGRSYVPDFLVRRRERPSTLVEVKPRELLTRDGEKLQEKFAAAKDFAAARGWRFEVWTEEQVRTPRLQNARFLLPYRRRSADAGLAARILAAVMEMGQAEADAVLERAFHTDDERARGLATLWHLVALGRLNADLDVPLSGRAPLSVPEVAHG